MLFILSPAKTLDFEQPTQTQISTPRLLEDSRVLVEQLRTLTQEDLEKLMKISPALAALNVQRFADFQLPFTPENAKPALQVFQGDVYQGLDAQDFTAQDLTYAQQHVRILSGLYGVLRPWDMMQAYRLEMGTKLNNARGKDLYQFWGTRITDLLNEDLAQSGSDALVNLASKEYFKAVKKKNVQGTIYQVDFKEWRQDKYKIIAFFAKKARGQMARYAVKHQVDTIEALKNFNEDNYRFNEALSTDTHLVFTRGEQ